MSRYGIDKICFHVGDEQFSFAAATLAHLPTVDDAGAEPGTPLYEILSVMEDANAPGLTMHFGPEHVETVVGDLQEFARTIPELSAEDRQMLDAIVSSSRN